LVKHFKDGNGHDQSASQQSTKNHHLTECNKQEVDVLITDQRTAVREIIAQLGTGHNAVMETIKTSGYWKVCHWVPQLLTDKHKRVCMDVLLQLFQWYAAMGNDFLLNIMAGDESWFHHFNIKTKQ
jgi:hypothetical protein